MSKAPPNRKTTIYDVAALADASPSTVSAVLSGKWKERRISEERAKRIEELATQSGYSLNMQARALRQERSGIIGMLVPMYDNRFFSSMAQLFETRARGRNLMPIVTSTQRDPVLEIAAARTMIAYQVEYLICAGATGPDQIYDLCKAAGIPVYNLDLPGHKAPSILTDNYGGALDLTRAVLERCQGGMVFIGGREGEHNSQERLRGFLDAHAERGIEVPETDILTCGYAPDDAELATDDYLASASTTPTGMFINSTTTLEGVIRCLNKADGELLRSIQIGCFDWDPFAATLGTNIQMVRQDVTQMMDVLFNMLDDPPDSPIQVKVRPAVSKA